MKFDHSVLIRSACACALVSALVPSGCSRRGEAPPTDLTSQPPGNAATGTSEKLARPTVSPDIDESLRNEALHAADIAVQWLCASQNEKGFWSTDSFPAMTALAISAILHSPSVSAQADRPEAVTRGLKFITSCVQPDGGIYKHIEGQKGGGLPNYNTALCLTALVDAGDPQYQSAIGNARAFLVAGQHKGEDVYKGGMGYDASTNRAYADLANTYFASRILRRTAPPESNQPVAEVDWDAMVGFVERCQHLKSCNDAEWVDESAEEKGGFIYNPTSTKAESPKEGVLPAYGSATYAGISAYVSAGLKPSDARVRAALKWAGKHWTLEDNPRLGQQSLYYYYMVLATALSAAGEELVETPDGNVKWRPLLVKQLVSLQRIDEKSGLGYWQNDNNRWWENDPNLATSYALQALSAALAA